MKILIIPENGPEYKAGGAATIIFQDVSGTLDVDYLAGNPVANATAFSAGDPNAALTPAVAGEVANQTLNYQKLQTAPGFVRDTITITATDANGTVTEKITFADAVLRFVPKRSRGNYDTALAAAYTNAAIQKFKGQLGRSTKATFYLIPFRTDTALDEQFISMSQVRGLDIELIGEVGELTNAIYSKNILKVLDFKIAGLTVEEANKWLELAAASRDQDFIKSRTATGLEIPFGLAQLQIYYSNGYLQCAEGISLTVGFDQSGKANTINEDKVGLNIKVQFELGEEDLVLGLHQQSLAA